MRAGAASGRLALLGALALAIGGCGGDADTMIEAGAAREGAEAQANKGRIEKKIDDLEQMVQKDPSDKQGNMLAVEKLENEAANAGVYDPLTARFAASKKLVNDSFETYATTRTEENVKTSHDLAAQGKLKEARDAAQKEKSRLGLSRQWAICEQELARLDQLERVEHVWTEVVAKKADAYHKSSDFERESGLFTAFLALGDAIPTFQESSHAADAKARLKDLGPLIEKAKASKAADNVPLLGAFTGRKEDLFKWNNDTESFECNDGIASLKSEDGNKIVTYGEEDWEDYAVTFEVKLMKGRLILGFHGTDQESGKREYDRLELTSLIPKAQWIKLRMETRGGAFSLIRTDTGESIGGLSPKYSKGPFGFLVAENGEAQFKSVWVKLFKGAPAK